MGHRECVGLCFRKVMNDNLLKQRRFLSQYTFRLVDDGIQVHEKSVLSSSKYKVPFENIAVESTEISQSSTFWFWAMVLLWCLSLLNLILLILGKDVESDVFIVWGIFASIASVAFYFSSKTYTAFVAGEPGLVLLKDKPSIEKMECFLKIVHDTKKEFLAQHYLIGSNESTKADAIHKLSWLQEHGVISKSDFEILKKEIVDNASGNDDFRISLN